MELQENSVIIDDRLDRMLEPELGGHFTHAYCTAGQCEVTFNGQVFTMHEGDCMIIIANQLVTAIRPSENFRVKVIYIEVGFLEACTPHTSYGVTGGLTMFVNPVMHLNEREQYRCWRCTAVSEAAAAGSASSSIIIIRPTWHSSDCWPEC